MLDAFYLIKKKIIYLHTMSDVLVDEGGGRVHYTALTY